MKTKIFYIITLFIFTLTNAQEKSKEKGDWFVNCAIGFSQIEIQNLGAFNGFVFANNIGKEFSLKNHSSILIGIEIQNIYHNYNSNSTEFHSKNTFIKIPLNYRYTTNKEINTNIFIDFGLYGSLLTKKNVKSDSLSESDNNLGTNFGLSLGFGLIQKINDFINFKINLNTQSDLIQNYKDENNKLTIKNLYAISFGIGVHL